MRAVLVFFLLVVGCTQTNVHQTAEVVGPPPTPCIKCHSNAYNGAMAPPHAPQNGGTIQNTCGDCHGTDKWTPLTGGHPETKFPITTGSHANKAIGCTDCHKASLGADTAGANTDCVDCHIGAHTTPSIDATHIVDSGVVDGYTPSSASTPHSCLGCHPTG